MRTDILSNTNRVVTALRMSFLLDHKTTLPPLTLKALYMQGATPASVAEQLDEEIKSHRPLAALLPPRLKRFLAGYRREKKARQAQSTPAISGVKARTTPKPMSQIPSADISIQVDREAFFQIGRALQRGIGKGKLGTVDFTVKDGTLTIESFWGGGRLPCTGDSAITATISATSFCALVTTRYREKQPAGTMKIEFRPSLKEIGIDLIGVKAQFPS